MAVHQPMVEKKNIAVRFSVFFIAVFLSLSPVLFPAQAPGNDAVKSSPYYLLIIDAGSSGSRLYVYKIKPYRYDDIPEIVQINTKKVEPGISCAGTCKLNLLLETANQEVPEEIREKTKDFDYTYSDLSKIDTPLRFYLGNYPGGDQPCWGGCINMLKGALATFESHKRNSLKRSRPLAMVVAEYEGDVDGQGYPIILIGDCTKIRGKVKGKTVRIRGCPVAIPIFAIFAPYYMRIHSPFLERNRAQTFGVPYQIAVSYLHKFFNRLF